MQRKTSRSLAAAFSLSLSISSNAIEAFPQSRSGAGTPTKTFHTVAIERDVVLAKVGRPGRDLLLGAGYRRHHTDYLLLSVHQDQISLLSMQGQSHHYNMEEA